MAESYYKTGEYSFRKTEQGWQRRKKTDTTWYTLKVIKGTNPRQMSDRNRSKMNSRMIATESINIWKWVK